MTETEASIRRAVVQTCREMVRLGLTHGTSGNVSARRDGGFLVTASGVSCASVTDEDIVAMRYDGTYRGTRRPSTEWRLHRDLLVSRPEVGAVVHTHSPYATAVSCLRVPIPAFHYMVAVAGGMDIRCADYATFGTEALSHAMLRAMEGRTACLLANHGVIAIGLSLQEALARAHEVEMLAKQYAIARSIGSPVLLGEVEMAEVLERFADYGRADEAYASTSERRARRDHAAELWQVPVSAARALCCRGPCTLGAAGIKAEETCFWHGAAATTAP